MLEGGTPSQVWGSRVPHPSLDGGGYPIPGLGWGLPHPRGGGYPSQVWMVGGTPSWGGYPNQVLMMGGYLGTPHPASRPGWGTPRPGMGYPPPSRPGWGTPHPGMGYPPDLGWGTPTIKIWLVYPPPTLQWGTPHPRPGMGYPPPPPLDS